MTVSGPYTLVKVKVGVIGEPFECIIIHGARPLPKTKDGNQCQLTIKCAATRFLEAFSLHNIKARSVTKALSQFFIVFGLPRVI